MTAPISLADSTYLGEAVRAHLDGNNARAIECWAAISADGIDAIRLRFATYQTDIAAVVAACAEFGPDAILQPATLPRTAITATASESQTHPW